MGAKRTEYSRERRAEVLARLQETADERGGTPYWAGIVRETGIGKATLRRWWKAQEKTAELHVLPSPPSTEERRPNIITPRESSESDYYLSEFFEAVRLTAIAEERDRWTALTSLLKRKDEMFRAAREAIAREAEDQGLTEDELLQILRTEASGMAPSHLEVFVTEAEKRGVL